MPDHGEQMLCTRLALLYGLRNIRQEWIRRQTSFTAEELRSVICRTDLCVMSYGTLPWDVSRAHATTLGVTTLLQVDDVINIACADPRQLTSNPRVFQATLTDGEHDFVGIELETPPSPKFAQVAAIPGAKLKVHPTARVRRGRLLLRPSDYTVLGLPTANIWGDLYNHEIAETRQAAGLPDHAANAQASLGRVVDSDDPRNATLVWTGESNDPNALPLNIGGIADPALLSALEEAENGVIVSQSQGLLQPQAQNQQPSQFQHLQPLVPSNITSTGVSHVTPTTPAPTSSPHQEPPAANRSRQVAQKRARIRSTNPVAAEVNTVVISDSMDIPDVPDSDEEDWLALMGTQENGQHMPKAPVERLVDDDATLIRAYCLRINKNSACATVLDDGTAMRTMKVGQGLKRQLLEANGADKASLSRGMQGLSGFMRVSRKTEMEVVDNDEDIEDGDPFVEEVRKLPFDATGAAWDVKDWLNKYADNVEGRLVKQIMGDY